MNRGMVMLADTRTNAGVDNIASFRKLSVWERPGDRVIALMTAGNLAISQTVVNMLNEGIELDGLPSSSGSKPLKETGEQEMEAVADQETGSGAPQTLLSVPSMFKAAQLVGAAVREVYRADGEALEAQDAKFDVSMILGGQIAGRRMRMFQIYSAGNFIEATEDTPFLQIGENKYGKPILDRAFNFDTALGSATKLAMVSMDSTLRSNLSVGMPLDLLVCERDTIAVQQQRRIEAEDDYFSALSQGWAQSLRNALRDTPDPPWFYRNRAGS